MWEHTGNADYGYLVRRPYDTQYYDDFSKRHEFQKRMAQDSRERRIREEEEQFRNDRDRDYQRRDSPTFYRDEQKPLSYGDEYANRSPRRPETIGKYFSDGPPRAQREENIRPVEHWGYTPDSSRRQREENNGYQHDPPGRLPNEAVRHDPNNYAYSPRLAESVYTQDFLRVEHPTQALVNQFSHRYNMSTIEPDMRISPGYGQSTYKSDYLPLKPPFTDHSNLLPRASPEPYEQKTIPTNYMTEYRKDMKRIVGSGNGLVFVRFSDNSFREMRNGLDKIKTTGLGSFGGKILGVARKDSIYLLDGNYDSGWEIPRRKGTSGPHTENSVLVLLFPDFDRANNFFLSTKNNALFQGDFPSPNGYEALYLKMNASGIDAGNVTFLVMEFPQAARQEYAITQYETELRKLEDGFRGRLCVANTTPQRIDRRPWFIHRNAWMQVHTFPSIADAQEFRSSAGFRRATDALTKVTGAYNAFAFTLKEMTTVEPY